MQTSTDVATIEIIDRIYDASTIEDAIYWREAFVRRLSNMIAGVDIMDPMAVDEVALYQSAKGQSEQAIARLQLALDKGEAFAWPSAATKLLR